MKHLSSLLSKEPSEAFSKTSSESNLEMMQEDEIVRRLRAILALPWDQRPFSVDRLEKVAGVADKVIDRVARVGRMQMKTRARLSRALRLFENNQVVVQKRHFQPTIVTIVAPRPPQQNVRCITFTKSGPKVTLVPRNPLTFPDFKDPLIEAMTRRKAPVD